MKVFDVQYGLAFLRKLVLSPFFWIFILSIFFLRTILFTPGTPHHGDLTYPTSIDLYQKALFPMWNENTSVSNFESIDRAFSLILVLVTRLVGGEVDLLSKLYFFVPLLLSGVTMAFLARFVLKKAFPKFSPNSLVIVVVAFTYMISPWVLEQLQAPFYWLAYAVTPAIILLSYLFFSERRLGYGIGLAVFWTIASTTPHYTVFSYCIIIFVWLALLFFNRSTIIDAIKSSFKTWGILLVLFLALNAYWVVPIMFALSYGPVVPGYVFTSDMLSLFSRNALHVLSGMDQWISWWPGQHSTFLIYDIVAVTFALLTTLGLAVLLAFRVVKRGTSDVRLFYVLFGIWIIGLFFSLGGLNPLYRWLATSAPFSSYYGWLLRVPGKISYLLWPTYAIAVGFVLQYVFTWYKLGGFKVKKRVVAALAIIALVIIANSYAVIKAEDYFNFYYAPVAIPGQYEEAFVYIRNNLTNARIADFARYENGTQVKVLATNYLDPENPIISIDIDGGNDLRHSNFSLFNYNEAFESSYNWNPNRIAGYFVPRSISVPNFGYYHFTYSGIWRPAYENFHESVTYTTFLNYSDSIQEMVPVENVTRFENIDGAAVSWLPVYGANYVIYHNDIFNTTEFASFDLRVFNESGCQLVAQWDFIYLYKLPESFGRIYALNSSWLGLKDRAPTKVDVNASGVIFNDVKQVDSTLWEIDLTASMPFTLVFTEGFDSYWTATIAGDNSIVEMNSEKAFGSINSFLVNQTGDLQVTIHYKPQIWLIYGITVSAVMLIVVGTSMTLRVMRDRRLVSTKNGFCSSKSNMVFFR